jgi:hypothetical protein
MRKLGVLLAAGLLMFSVVSCSTKKNEDVSATSPSTEAQSSGDDETSTTKKTTSTDGGDSSDGSSVLDNLETCGAVSGLAVTLGLGAAFLSDDQQAELEQELEDLRGKVPDEIQDDIDTLQNGAANADGFAELGEFLDSDEYREATDNIGQWLDENCNVPEVGN